MSNLKKFRILLLEDSSTDAFLLRVALADALEFEHELTQAETLAQGLALTSKGTFDVVLLDLGLPDSQGFSTFVEFYRHSQALPILVLTGLDDATVGLQAVGQGAQDYLSKKSINGPLLNHAIRYAIERHDVVVELDRSTKELAASEARIRTVIEASADAILIVDGAGKVKFANPAGVKMFDQAESGLLETPLGIALVEGGTVEIDVKHRDGATTTAEMRLVKIQWYGEAALLATLRDITDRRRLEQRLRQAQKMEAVGQLAGSIAHDFNNLLTIINGCCESAASLLHEGDLLYEDIHEIHQAGLRAARLTSQLLSFSHQKMLSVETLDLNEGILNVERMLERIIGETIRLKFIPGERLWPVNVDRGSLEQVLMNLVINARDAMPGGGVITIETANQHLDVVYKISHPVTAIGDHVLLAVSDTGHGMDEQTQSHIFEPFFTTKGEHRGTGLGLATVYGIVQQSGGHIEVYSQVGLGTCFKVYLPRAQGEIKAKTPELHHQDLRGTETILVVEDDANVRRIAVSALRVSGYTVLEASDGLEALALLKRDHESPSIDLLLTDVVMPNLGGSRLAEYLRGEQSRIKVLYVSGYTEETAIQQGMLSREAAFLQKPYSLKKLRQCIREQLSGHHHGAS